MEKNKRKVIELLLEARSNELALIDVLGAHLSVTDPGSYRSTLETHLRETKDHADKIGHRLTRLGHRESIPEMARGAVVNIVKQGIGLTKTPIDLIRGRGDSKEKVLRNAIDEAMTEGLEIGLYDAIESFALSIGDHGTAGLVAEIRFDEERMFDSLRKEIPALAVALSASLSTPAERAVEEPWVGYDEQTVEEIVTELDDASEAIILVVLEYESGNRNRSTILNATSRDRV
jgi:ferritin-like metal-binding protein YciE